MFAEQVSDLVSGIEPWDRQESDDKADTLAWVASGAPQIAHRPGSRFDPNLPRFVSKLAAVRL